MDVLMPQLGETVAEGKIVKWFVKAGDAIKPGDNLFEVETDKASMEVPATFGGTLSDIHFSVGETAKVGAAVATIAVEGEVAAPKQAPAGTPVAIPPHTPPVTPAQIGSAPVPHAPRSDERKNDAALAAREFSHSNMTLFNEVRSPERNYGPAKTAGGTFVTPLARRLASECGIDLSRLSGTGPHGRIVAGDVDKAQPASGGGASMATGASFAQVKALYEGVEFEEVPLDGMRATIAKRLVEAKQTIPHFYLTADIDIGRLVAMREDANRSAPKSKEGDAAFKLSLNDFVIKAWAAALQRIPAANAVWAGDRVLRFNQADIGIAVALEGGLITPVVRNADTKSITAISNEVRDMAVRAKNKKLKANEYQGGSSAISNLGMYGVREFSAIINPPQATILAVGASRRDAVEAEDGSVKFVSMMTVTVSCDHRVIDGALGAELLAAFKRIAEDPISILM